VWIFLDLDPECGIVVDMVPSHTSPSAYMHMSSAS